MYLGKKDMFQNVVKSLTLQSARSLPCRCHLVDNLLQSNFVDQNSHMDMHTSDKPCLKSDRNNGGVL